MLRLLFALVFGLVFAVQTDAAPQDELYQTISSLDTQVFGAYNTCDLEKLATFFSEDLEFYHDQTGLSRGRDPFIKAIKANICGKVRRDLTPGTLEVYPLEGFGAVEIGVHAFCHPDATGKCDKPGGPAKFVHVWQHDDAGWRITRVISFDHH